MRLCIVKLGVVSSIYGYFGEETGWRCMYAQSSPIWVLQREFSRFWHTHRFINLKTFVCMQNPAFVRTHIF